MQPFGVPGGCTASGRGRLRVVGGTTWSRGGPIGPGGEGWVLIGPGTNRLLGYFWSQERFANAELEWRFGVRVSAGGTSGCSGRNREVERSVEL